MSASARDRQQARKRAAQLRQRQERLRRRRKRNSIIFAVLAVAAAVAIGFGILARPSTDEPTATNPLVPPSGRAQAKDWTVTMETNRGTIEMVLHGGSAPQAVSVVLSLIGEDFYDKTDCHRLTTSGIYVLQCGDPSGTGSGGPAYRFGPIENAPADNLYPEGTVAMARAQNDGDSMGSQFFIVYQDSTIPADDAGGYTVIGEVTQGLDIVKEVAEGGTITGATDGQPALSVILTKVSAS